jgi:hypothetical protein
MLTKGNYQKFMKGLTVQILPFQIIPLISRIPYLFLESDQEHFAAAEPVAFLRSFALSLQQSECLAAKHSAKARSRSAARLNIHI